MFESRPPQRSFRQVGWFSKSQTSPGLIVDFFKISFLKTLLAPLSHSSVGMVYVEEWDAFLQQSQAMVQSAPTLVRIRVLLNACGNVRAHSLVTVDSANG